MEKSDHYYIRKQRMRDLEAPVMSEVRQELGHDLAETLFKICPNALKPILGLTPMLSGAGDDLWISPSDMMIGKVVLKPPFTSKYMKALTHQGILTIGHDVEKKFLCEFDLAQQRALKEQEEMLLFIAEQDKRKAMEEVREKERGRQAEEVARLMAEFKEKLQKELSLLEKKLKKQYTLLMRRQKEQLEGDWREKLEMAVSEAVERLTDKFLKDMEAQEKDLLRRFEVEVKKEKIKTKMKMEQVQERSQETFNQLKHQMRCKNISNIMYVLCMERRKCQAERDHIQAKFEERCQELRNEIAEKDEQLAKLTADRDYKARQVNLREECLLEVLRQFQKFINFALRSFPTQAEFLLSVEKMMIFELAQACARTDQTRARRLVKTLLPWQEESVGTESLVEKTSFKSLEPMTPHDCYNEIDTPVESEDRSFGSDDYLPALHYNENMYVREEFRNMMSQGIKLSPSNLIWNKEVEHMMNILRQPSDEVIKKKETAFDVQETVSRTSVESSTIRTESHKTKSCEDVTSTTTSGKAPSDKRPPRRSIVYFRSSTDENNFLFPIFESASSMRTSPTEMFEEMSQATKSEKEEYIIEKECCIPCMMHREGYQVAIKDRGRILPLIGARDSVEIVKPPSDTGLLCAQDSLHKHRMSLKPVHTTMVSRESIAVNEILTLGKRTKRSAEDVHKSKYPPSPPEDTGSLDMHRPSMRRTSKDSKIQFCISDEKPPRRRTLTERDENLTLSKLSLARDSIIVNKRSLILKKDPVIPIKQPEPMSDRSSEETLQLKKPRHPGSENFSEHQSLKWGTGSDGQESRASYTVSFLELSNAREPSSLLDMPVPTSKITLSRDSLDLVRIHSRTSTGAQLKSDSKHSIEIRNEILLDTHYPTPMAHIKGDPSKAVRISQMETAQPLKDTAPAKHKKTKIKPETDSPWLVYHDKEGPLPLEPQDAPQRENFITKPNVVCIVGDQQSTSGNEKCNKFAIHRAESLLAVFRKNPSLIKLFTSCSQ